MNHANNVVINDTFINSITTIIMSKVKFKGKLCHLQWIMGRVVPALKHFMVSNGILAK